MTDSQAARMSYLEMELPRERERAESAEAALRWWVQRGGRIYSPRDPAEEPSS